jgi:hypothetical protein
MVSGVRRARWEKKKGNQVGKKVGSLTVSVCFETGIPKRKEPRVCDTEWHSR